MAKIRFVNGDECTFISVKEQAANDPALKTFLETRTTGEGQGTTFVHHPGSTEEPQLFEKQFPAHAKVPAHAHDADEIIVVVEGEILFGKQAYGAGSSVFIPKMTLYSFQAGAAGLRFLNFRPTTTSGAILKDDFMAMRGQEPTPAT